MPKRLHRFDMNRPSSRSGLKHSKGKKCDSITMFTCIKQHLINI